MQMTQHRGTWGTYTSQTKQKIRIVVIFIGFAGFSFTSLERALFSCLLTAGGQPMEGQDLNPNF